eukprot:9713462-Lingulodinium_polyedra.AAC.1
MEATGGVLCNLRNRPYEATDFGVRAWLVASSCTLASPSGCWHPMVGMWRQPAWRRKLRGDLEGG